MTEDCSILKQGKSDGDKELLSDHIIHGSKVLFTLIFLLMSTSRKHGYMPEELLMASISDDKCGNICHVYVAVISIKVLLSVKQLAR